MVPIIAPRPPRLPDFAGPIIHTPTPYVPEVVQVIDVPATVGLENPYGLVYTFFDNLAPVGQTPLPDLPFFGDLALVGQPHVIEPDPFRQSVTSEAHPAAQISSDLHEVGSFGPEMSLIALFPTFDPHVFETGPTIDIPSTVIESDLTEEGAFTNPSPVREPHPPEIPEVGPIVTPEPRVPENVPIIDIPTTVIESDLTEEGAFTNPLPSQEPQPPEIPEVGPIFTPEPRVLENVPIIDIPTTVIESDLTEKGHFTTTPIDAVAGALVQFDDVLGSSRYSTIRGSGVTIAIIDSGVQDHMMSTGGAFANRVVATLDFAETAYVSGAATTNDDSLHNPVSTNLHGTHVAGIAAGKGTIGGTDYVGIAPDASLIILKVAPSGQAPTAIDIKQAVDWLAANSATYNVAAVNISISIGSGRYITAATDANFTPSFQTLAANGVTVVASAGNSYDVPNPDTLGVAYPSADPWVWSVGAVWKKSYPGVGLPLSSGVVDANPVIDHIVGYSQRSPFGFDGSGNPAGIEMLAPGSAVNSFVKNASNVLDFSPDVHGTSFAAPYVTGAAALGQDLSLDMTEQFARLNVATLRDLMRASATTVSDTIYANDGVLNTQEQSGFSSNYDYKRLDVMNFLGEIEDHYKVSTSGADLMAGWVDNDTLTGQGGNDRVYGNAGNDTLFGEGGDDTLIGGIGVDYLFGGNGTPAAAGSGNDTLFGRDGDDGIWAGDGVDTLYGENGVDGLVGNAGNDTIYGGAGADNLFGGDGAGAAGSGVDTLYGDAGNDAIYGEDGNDYLSGGAENDYIDGGADADNVLGDAGNDNLLGGAGADQIFGGAGFDYEWGGAGADRFVFKVGDSYDAVIDFSKVEGDGIGLDLAFGISTFAGFQAAITSFVDGGVNYTHLLIGSDRLQIANMATTDWTTGMVTFV